MVAINVFDYGALVVYLSVINGITLINFGVDKALAGKVVDYYRIPENFLHFLSLLCGQVGYYMGMLIFRHKIRKREFYIKPLLCFLLNFPIWVVFISGFIPEQV
jgi:uncharacterized membrane protein YsdA (DUF1294 family)